MLKCRILLDNFAKKLKKVLDKLLINCYTTYEYLGTPCQEIGH